MHASIDGESIKPGPKIPGPLQLHLTLLRHPVTLPVCLECQTAVLPRSLLDHLRKHHQLPLHLRRDVRCVVAALQPLDFSDVPPNPDGSAPVEGLRVVDAFQCKQCAFIRRDVSDVRKHVNSEHNLPATGSYEKIRAQSWFGGRRAAYWRLCDDSTQGAPIGCQREYAVNPEDRPGPECRGSLEVTSKLNLDGSRESPSQDTTESEKTVAMKMADGTVCLWGFFGASYWYKHPSRAEEIAAENRANQ